MQTSMKTAFVSFLIVCVFFAGCKKGARTTVPTEPDSAPRAPYEITTGDYTFRIENGAATLIAYHGTNAVAMIPSCADGVSVTVIARTAFEHNANVKGVALPESVTGIEAYAFNGCSALSAVTLPTIAPIVGENAFEHSVQLHAPFTAAIPEAYRAALNAYEAQLAFSLVSVNAGEATGFTGTEVLIVPSIVDNAPVTAIANKAFKNETFSYAGIAEGVSVLLEGAFQFCESLKEITLPESVTAIHANGFYACGSLTGIVLPSGLATISSDLFSYCSSLAAVTFPPALMSINARAFSYCDSLTNVVIPDTVEELLWYAFTFCSNLRSVTLPKNLKFIDADIFYHCVSLERIDIPEGVTKIGTGAFYQCYALGEASIPSTLTEVHNDVFSECSNLSNVTLAEGLAVIGPRMFFECRSLRNIVLPSTLTVIHLEAFSRSALRSVYAPWTNASHVTAKENILLYAGTGPWPYLYVPFGTDTNTYAHIVTNSSFRITVLPEE